MADISSLDGTIIVASVSVVGIIVAIFFNIKANKQAARASFLELIGEHIRHHAYLMKAEGDIKNEKEAWLHVITYFDFLDHIAVICLNKDAPKEMGQHFKEYFSYVQAMMEWYDETADLYDEFNGNTDPKQKSMKTKDRWPNILDWCKVDDIKKDDAETWLPDTLIEIRDEYKKKLGKSTKK